MSEDRFKNRKEALDWLQQRGQISQGKFYQDCDRGYVEYDGRQIPLTVHADKTISKFQIMLYAEGIFGFTRQNIASVDLAEKKEKLSVEEQELKIDKLKREKHQSEREQNREWKHRDESDEQLAGIIGMLLDASDHQFYKGAPELIQISGGNPARVDEVYATMQALFSNAINEVLAAGQIDGVFEAIDPEDDE
jgi:hypothetical protein